MSGRCSSALRRTCMRLPAGSGLPGESHALCHRRDANVGGCQQLRQQRERERQSIPDLNTRQAYCESTPTAR
eukprot:1094354-Prymnesium_polylepis.1